MGSITQESASINSQIEAARTRWAAKRAQQEAENAAEAERNQAIAAKAYAELQQRLAQHLPAWMLEYIQPQTRMEFDAGVELVDLLLPGCAPLMIVLERRFDRVSSYDVREPVCVRLDEDWWVKSYGRSVDDLDRAIDMAASWGESWHEMQMEAARRNELGIEPAATAQAGGVALTEACKMLNRVNAAWPEHNDFQSMRESARAIAHALVAIAHLLDEGR